MPTKILYSGYEALDLSSQVVLMTLDPYGLLRISYIAQVATSNLWSLNWVVRSLN